MNDMKINQNQAQGHNFDENMLIKSFKKTNLNTIVEIYEQRDSFIKQIQNCWPQWAHLNGLDPQYGFLLPPDYKPTSFDFSVLQEVLSNLPQLSSNGSIITVVQQFPSLKLHQPYNFRDMNIIHDCTISILCTYMHQLRRQHIEDQNMTLISNLAQPLYIASEYLKCNKGFNTGLQYNWRCINNKLIEDADNLTFQDIRLNWYFTHEQYWQRLFFGGSVLGAYYLAKVNKAIFEIKMIIVNIPQHQDEIISRLHKIRQYWSKIINQCRQLVLHLDTDYFFNQLRPYFIGYNNVYFQGVGSRFSAKGGSGGSDPSYQIFQTFMGIQYDEGLSNIQILLQQSMPEMYRILIKKIKQSFSLRTYCKCSNQLINEYNLTIETYAKFIQLHNKFIKMFIIKHLPENMINSSEGTNGSNLLKFLEKSQQLQKCKLQMINCK